MVLGGHTYFLSLPKDMFIDFREKGREGRVGGLRDRDRDRERQRDIGVREKHLLVASHIPRPGIKPSQYVP